MRANTITQDSKISLKLDKLEGYIHPITQGLHKKSIWRSLEVASARDGANGQSGLGWPSSLRWSTVQGKTANRPRGDGYPSPPLRNFWVFKPMLAHSLAHSPSPKIWEFLSLNSHPIFSISHSLIPTSKTINPNIKCTSNNNKSSPFNNQNTQSTSSLEIKPNQTHFSQTHFQHQECHQARIQAPSIHSMGSKASTRHHSMMPHKIGWCLNPTSISHSSIPNKK